MERGGQKVAQHIISQCVVAILGAVGPSKAIFSLPRPKLKKTDQTNEKKLFFEKLFLEKKTLRQLKNQKITNTTN
ncbi:MAG: hypothetical protein IIW59_02665 [Alistipes sp.]|nr:hypothetical protein [Alistipes sp.]